jgi:hypothetical protein
MWDDISPENSKLLVYSTVLGVPIGLKITGGGEHSFVPPKDLTFLCLCTLEEFRADHREARLLIRTPPPWILQQEQTWDSNNVQCFTLLPFGENERSTDIRHFITSQPPFLFEYCKPMIPLAVGDKICMLNACPCMLDFTDFVWNKNKGDGPGYSLVIDNTLCPPPGLLCLILHNKYIEICIYGFREKNLSLLMMIQNIIRMSI